ncbi:MAG: ferrous iron transport protein B [Saprospiraceae bacterium]|nr:ferrous iron transport protein B [Saprospiraceae bacterium]
MGELQENLKVALVGNPNSGKSSLFNILTGLRQSVSNFPGVTVDKKVGSAILSDKSKVTLIDLPGLYSLHPNSRDEKLVVNILTDQKGEYFPDLVIYVADATNLERHLLLATQIVDLKIPMIFVLNMIDILEEKNQKIEPEYLSKYLDVPVIQISGRKSKNIDTLKSLIKDYQTKGSADFLSSKQLYAIPKTLEGLTFDIAQNLNVKNPYLSKIFSHHFDWLNHFSEDEKEKINSIATKHEFDNIKNQLDETMSRYNEFGPIARKVVTRETNAPSTITDKIDSIITHRILGPILFFAIMLFVFQAIYSWSEAPMDWIEQFFAFSGNAVRNIMPEGWYTDLIVDGIIAGLGGILIFIPQITILFLLISILEETGYMSRAVFMFDGLMQKFGLNGRSIVSLVSSGACAIPAIMATRTISSWKERLNTILVSPLISCSARIPVYAVLIAFVVPKDQTFGIFNLQGLAFMGLYLLGIAGALAAALVFKYALKVENDNSYLMIELPQYKPPIWKNAILNVKEKVTTFIVEAGKVILVISILLWFLASYGPSSAMKQAELSAIEHIETNNLTEIEGENYLAGKKIEASFAGHLGKFIEPAIKPLGFDWKIGIALITSFAAREVFVGTMATIYSVGSADDEATVSARMAAEINPQTGEKVYNPATSLSLLIFYVFAMQCMSTLAVVRRETNSWKWPAIQFFFMGAMAYFGSLITYQLLS